jgi:hypothetical protein
MLTFLSFPSGTSKFFFFPFASQSTARSASEKFNKHLLYLILCFFIYSRMFSELQIRLGSRYSVNHLSKCRQYCSPNIRRERRQKTQQLHP